MSILILGVGKHTGLTDKEIAGIIDHANDSVRLAKLINGILSADAPGRLKMADGFITLPKMSSGVLVCPATRVIAASNAVTPARADYPCDNIDDEEQLNQGRADMGGIGGLEELTEGTFTVGTGTFYLGNRHTLQGRGKDVTIIKAKNGATVPLLTASAVTDVLVRDLTLDGNQAGGATGRLLALSSVQRVRFERVKFMNCPNLAAIYPTGANNPGLEFVDCVFADLESHAIDLTGSTTCEWFRVVGCLFNSVKGYGITGGVTVNLPSGRIQNNEFRFVGLSGYSSVYLTLDHDTQVTGNIVIGGPTGHRGMDIRGVIFSGLVANNTFYQTVQDALFLDGSKFSVIGNVIYAVKSFYSGIYMEAGSYNLLLEGNVVYACQDHGIQVRGSYHSILNNMLIDNGQRVDNTAYDIWLNGATDCLVEGNRIRATLAKKTAFAIRESGAAARNTIQGNPINTVAGRYYSLLPNTISAGGIAVGMGSKGRLYVVDTEGGAATDDLDSITGGAQGEFIVLKAANSARTVVVKHATGNLRLDGLVDFSLDNADDSLLLMSDGTNWLEMSRSSNGA